MSFSYTPPPAAGTGTGGLEYKGTFNPSTGLPDLSNAEQGDFYVIASGITNIEFPASSGLIWNTGDHLLINEDMGGTVTASKIDKVDNTDSVSSVNGQVGTVVLNLNDIDDVTAVYRPLDEDYS